jgi:hypothetical protein
VGAPDLIIEARERPVQELSEKIFDDVLSNFLDGYSMSLLLGEPLIALLAGKAPSWPECAPHNDDMR